MTDEHAIREAARERLFDAALAEAMQDGAVAAPPRPSSSARLLVAALVMLGGMAIVAAAWWEKRAADPAQEPVRFDPIFPRVEREYPCADDLQQVGTLAMLAALPATARSIGVVVAGASNASDPEVVLAAARRPGVRGLYFATDRRPVPAEVWQAIGDMRELELLDLTGSVTAADLRELRRAACLRTLMLGPRTVVDREVAAALCELPKLSTLSLALGDARSSGLAGLAGLPQLEALVLEQCKLEDDWTQAIGRLRPLRWLCVYGKRFNGPPLPFTVADAQHLAELPRLSNLKLGGVAIDAGAVAALPASLEVLDLMDAEPLVAADLQRLGSRAQLRGLLLGSVAPADEATLAAVLSRLRLEHFGYRQAQVPEKVWDAVCRQPGLRRLTIACRDRIAADVAHCATLKRLEELELDVCLPADVDLSPLAALPKLRRVEVTDGGGHTGPPEWETLAARLRGQLAPGVEVLVR